MRFEVGVLLAAGDKNTHTHTANDSPTGLSFECLLSVLVATTKLFANNYDHRSFLLVVTGCYCFFRFTLPNQSV